MISIYKRRTDKLYSITLTNYKSVTAHKECLMLYLDKKSIMELRDALNKLRFKPKGGRQK